MLPTQGHGRMHAVIGIPLVFWLAPGAMPARAITFDEATTAYGRGDYATAVEGLRGSSDYTSRTSWPPAEDSAEEVLADWPYHVTGVLLLKSRLSLCDSAICWGVMRLRALSFHLATPLWPCAAARFHPAKT